jgi:hypothetical protein
MKTFLILLVLALTCIIAPAQKTMRDYVRIVYGGDTLDIKLSGDSVVLLTNQKIFKLRKDFRASRLYQGTDTVLSGRAMAADTSGLTPRGRYDAFISAAGNVYIGKGNKRGDWVKLNYILPLIFLFRKRNRKFKIISQSPPYWGGRVGLLFILLFFPLFASAQTGNSKIIDNLELSLVTDTFKKEILADKYGLDKTRVLEVQVAWSGLTGTLDAKIEIQERGASDMPWVCVQSVEADPGNMVKTLSTAAGSYPFILWAWCANDMRILVIKNNCTGGRVNASLGLRR